MLFFEIFYCLVTHSCISARLSLTLSQVCKHAREYVDICWTQLIVPGKMQAVYTMCNPPNVKVFVLTYSGFFARSSVTTWISGRCHFNAETRIGVVHINLVIQMVLERKLTD